MGANVRQVFMVWVLVFGMVGAQMSWVLRPFISAPDHPFILIAPRESNFYAAVFNAIGKMLGG
jgi:2-keto-3-deoxy-galactonokinase